MRCNKVIEGVNDLLTVCPDLAAEWDYDKNGDLTPNSVAARSGKKVWWNGSCGHKWPARIYSRYDSYGKTSTNGCPVCRREYQTSLPEQALFYYISLMYPDAISGSTSFGCEFDIYIPSKHTAIEYDGSAFHTNVSKDIRKNDICKTHKIRLIRVRELKCPPIDGCDVIVRQDYNDLSLDIAIADVLTLLSSDICEVDVNVRRDYIRILNQYRHTKHNKSLAVLRPDIAAEWHPDKNGDLTPDMFSVCSNVHVWWQCSVCGYEWKTAICARTSQGHGCFVCGFDKIRLSKNRKVICIEPNIVYESISDARKAIGLPKANIGECCRGKSDVAGGYHWAYYDEYQKNPNVYLELVRNYIPYSAGIKVVCVETDCVYDSIRKGELDLGISPGSISACLRGRLKTTGGYHWASYEDYSVNKEYYKSLIGERIYPVHTEGVHVICVETGVEYKSGVCAALAVGVSNRAVSAVLKGKCKTAGGYHWRYADESEIK